MNTTLLNEIETIAKDIEQRYYDNTITKTEFVKALNEMLSKLHILTNDDKFNKFIKVRNYDYVNQGFNELSEIHKTIKLIKGNKMDTLEKELNELEKELNNKEDNLIKDIKQAKTLLDDKKAINDKLDILTITTYETSIILLNNKIRNIVLDETLEINKNKKVKSTIKAYKEELINKANIEKDNKVFKGLNIAIKVLNNSNNVSFAKLKMLSFEIATKYSKLSNSNRNKINFKDNVIEISETIVNLYSEQLLNTKKDNEMKIYNKIKKELNK